MPTDRLTIRSTIFASSENEKTAAAEMLITPAMVVASRMEISGESILGLGKYATKLQIKAQTGRFGKLKGVDWNVFLSPKVSNETLP
jgi:hypothetical protein